MSATMFAQKFVRPSAPQARQADRQEDDGFAKGAAAVSDLIRSTGDAVGAAKGPGTAPKKKPPKDKPAIDPLLIAGVAIVVIVLVMKR